MKAAQGTVLHSLYGVGTDMTVTETSTPNGNGGQSFSFRGPDAGSTTGTKSSTTTSDNLRLAPGTSAITTATLTKIKGVSGVTAAVGSLTLNDFNISTTVSQQVTQNSASGGSGGFERGGTGGEGPQFGGPAQGGGNFNSTSVAGVDVSNLTVGPMSSLTTDSGRTLKSSDATSYVAVVTKTYASSKSLKLGGTVTLGGKAFTIVGLVSGGSSSTNVYIPLSIAQTLSSETGSVSTVYIKAGNSTEIDAVAAAIKKADSSATVTTSADLAKSVSGSLASTASLADNLGKWLSIAVLIAAFAVAALFTVSAVGRRVREFGTLKALGWTSRRVVRQVMGEAIVTGLIGGALGIGLGFAGAFAIGRFAPTLTASTGGSSAPTGNVPGGGGFAPPGRNTASTVSVHLSAPVALNVLLLAVALAVLGGLIAGGFGGWRASSLRPADALRKVA